MPLPAVPPDPQGHARWPPASAWLLAPGLLALLVAVLHGSALGTGWVFEDPALLDYAARYTPRQYFTEPAVMRLLSYAHVTPWSPLSFDLGLQLFGLDPRGHHLLLLAVLWACACATWALLRTRLDDRLALACAALFLALPPTGVVAQLLITAHYAWGLLFSIAACAAWACALREDRLAWAAAAAGACALASLCKELYALLPLALLAWPGVPIQRRLRLAWPLILAVIGYALLRWAVVGGVGGYATWQVGGSLLRPLADGLARAPGTLAGAILGHGLPATVAAGALLLALGLAAAQAWRHGQRALVGWGLLWVLVLLGPLLPTSLFTLPYGVERLMLWAGWAGVVLAGWGLRRWRHGWALPLLAGALLVPAQRGLVQGLRQGNGPWDAAQTDFLVHGAPGQRLLPQNYDGIGRLEALRRAVKTRTGRDAPQLVASPDALADLSPADGRAVLAWQAGCACLRPLGDEHARRVRDFQHRTAAGGGRPLNVRLDLQPHGRLWVFAWAIDGTPGQAWLEVQGMGRLDLPASGRTAFGEDISFRLSNRTALPVRVNLQAADGGWVRSPWLMLPTRGGPPVGWTSGTIAAAPPPPALPPPLQPSPNGPRS